MLRGMFGLEVTLPGQQPIIAALDQGRYVVSAGACWRRRAPTKQPELYFQASGRDDGEDHVVWLDEQQPAMGSWLDIGVVDADVATVPRAKPRSKRDWQRFFAQLRARDQKQIALLEARLKRLAAGRVTAPREWALRPPQVAFRVTLNAKVLCTAAVADPGSLTITIHARLIDSKRSALLSILGGDQKGPETWQWYDWKVKERLSLGDRLRISVLEPGRTSPREASRPELPPTRETMTMKLDELRSHAANAGYYEAEARIVSDYQRKRPPQRRYPR